MICNMFRRDFQRFPTKDSTRILFLEDNLPTFMLNTTVITQEENAAVKTPKFPKNLKF